MTWALTADSVTSGSSGRCSSVACLAGAAGSSSRSLVAAPEGRANTSLRDMSKVTVSGLAINFTCSFINRIVGFITSI